MRTDELIEALAIDTPALSAGYTARRIGLATLIGALAAFGLFMAWLGPRPDLARAVGDVFFWIKLEYAAAFALAGAALAERYARPAGRAGPRAVLVVAPIVVLVLIAVAVSIGRAPARLAHDWLGQSWMICPFRILALATPVFIAALWGIRRLAPTRLAHAGFAAGLLAVYCLFCQESTALFVVTWYSLGILACGGIGALIGPRVLRW
jgi:hypothetical protein